MAKTYNIRLKIKRYDPDTGKKWVQAYAVEVGGVLRFVDVFRKVNKEQDPTLAWNSACEHGQCGTCSIKVNGKPVLACELLVENAIKYFNTKKFKIGPLEIAPVVRDLIIDLEYAYKKIDKAKPYIIEHAALPPEENQYRIFPGDQEKYVDATRCINCFCCVSACMSSQNGFIGPNAIMLSVSRLMDPREKAKGERLKLLCSEEGLYRCHTSKACSFVCPKEIDVAHFIALAKEGRFGEKGSE